jgi:response regulator RpfG family c-di-GMP phosphodiesterase
MARNLLLVDDEQNILAALRRLFRRDGYTIFMANSGREGLQILEKEEIGVIVSDQRMPEMIGSDFLQQAKQIRPETIRIILSGFTELASVTDAINRGAVYKFLTKPWDDDLLREHVQHAFTQYELMSENQRLTAELKASNLSLSNLVDELENRVLERTRDLQINLDARRVEQEILDALPIGVVGISEDGMIVVANRAALQLLGQNGLVSQWAESVFPPSFFPIQVHREPLTLDLPGGQVLVNISMLGTSSCGRGWITMLTSISPTRQVFQEGLKTCINRQS